MKASKKRYDNKHKVTRVFLADYILLKGYAQDAGVSMAEALHKIITRDWAMTKRKVEPIAVATKPAFRVTAPVIAFQSRPQPIIVANGHKAGLFVIKPKGGIIQ